LKQLNTPILFLIFNRPDHTKQIFNLIRSLAPKKLYLASDGPRMNHIGDIEKVSKVRHIALNIDWDCEVKSMFRDSNLGCKYAVSSAISWFFEHEEHGIILEDDVLPDPSFFYYCQDLLNKYKDDTKVWGICGTNFQNGISRGKASYYFSQYPDIWGWATWRRAWKHYDVEIRNWKNIRNSIFWSELFPIKAERRYWSNIFDKVYSGNVDTWDYQWNACVFFNRGLFAVPNVNLVTNIGYGVDATHTLQPDPILSNMPSYSLGNLVHTDTVFQNIEADQFHSSRFCIRDQFIFKAYSMALFRKFNNLIIVLYNLIIKHLK